MSRHDLVSAQISNVCVTRHAALNAIAYNVCVQQFVMSLPAISLGYWSVGAERVGQGEVGWYIHPEGENNTAVCGFGCKKSLSMVITQMVLENSHPPHRASISFQG